SRPPESGGRGALSEAQPHLRLERTRAGLIVRQISEVTARVVDRDCGSCGQRIGMIQHVCRVPANLNRFVFGNPESLTDISIEAERSGHIEGRLAQGSLSSGLRILQND